MPLPEPPDPPAWPGEEPNPERAALDAAYMLVRLRDHLGDDDPLSTLDKEMDTLRAALIRAGHRAERLGASS